MLVLRACGVLEQSTVFEGSDQVTERLDGLPRLKGQRGSFDHLWRSGRLSPEHHRAVGDLLRRTKRSESAPVRARRAALRALQSGYRALFRRAAAG
jgi:hypothetical protein